ncbi:DUF2768 domain-containing protein [Calidifontibacillus oryziterrae]|uniref:DUF2768 domain-containing protein n=1 Tax=Calidifontibacillus oryziterrae TaxID=1191699 RepID=UPI0002F81EEF|nr:DUF2768 domain-containing protein [Calidifontibacillus oryziterrae]
MTPGILKMWISFAGIAAMFLSLLMIYLSRFKLKGVLKNIFAVFAYLFMIISGLIIFYVVFSGPVPE